MIPFWVSLLPALGCACVGIAFDRVLDSPLSTFERGRSVAAIACGLTLMLALLLHPLCLAGLLACCAWAAQRESSTLEPGDLRAGRNSWWLIHTLVAVVIISRVPFPRYWDEFVWLSKVRLSSESPLLLRHLALDSADLQVIPRGYPLFASWSASLFAFSHSDVRSLIAGSAAMTWLSFALAWLSLRRAAQMRWVAILGCIPLLWIHLRSAYVDLPVGFLSCALFGSLERATRGQRGAAVLSCIVAFLLAGTKDEGVLHAAAIASAMLFIARDKKGEHVPALAAFVSAALAATSWRVLLWSHQITNADHGVHVGGIERTLLLWRELGRSLLEIRSWGLFWPLALGALASSLSLERVRPAALASLLQWGALLLALALGGERLATFVLDGTVANRLLVQLTPLAALCLAYASLGQRRTPD